MNKEELLKLSRKKLQNLAKKHGVKANYATPKMVEELLKVMGDGAGNENNEDCVKKESETCKESLPDSDSSSLVQIPLYWGSALEGTNDPRASFDSILEQGPRQASVALMCEPYIMQLFRRAGASGVSREAVDGAKKILVEMIAKTCSSIPHKEDTPAKGKDKRSVNDPDIGPDDVKVACRSWGFHMHGAQAIHNHTCPRTDLLSVVSNKYKEETKEWDVFGYALNNLNKLPLRNVYSLLEVKKLVDTGRATVANVETPSVVAQACTSLDSYVFRYLVSFLVENPRATTYTKKYELFTDNDDIADNWDDDIDVESLEEVLNQNVDVLQAEDGHTGATLLHNFSVKNKPEDCQKLIEMGMDVNVTTGSMFENGDGWGELEYLSFTALHFACSNGYSDVARVLLRNGASTSVTAGWDGGYLTPVVRPGSEYFYTTQNTPLHQAARGNHANIIHLLLDGPDAASRAYAESKNIDLSDWENVDIEENSPHIDTYDEDGGNEENFRLTPLGMALIFGNLDAALALLQHGADFNAVTVNNKVRKRIVYCVLKKAKDFKDKLKESLEICPHDEEDALWKCSEANDAEDEDDEENPWDKDDWDRSQVIFLEKTFFVEYHVNY